MKKGRKKKKPIEFLSLHQHHGISTQSSHCYMRKYTHETNKKNAAIKNVGLSMWSDQRKKKTLSQRIEEKKVKEESKKRVNGTLFLFSC